MAVDTLYFSRDSKMYIEIGSNVWEIPVLDGFSFSQANNSTEVTLSEMEDSAGTSKRGRKVFNDSLAPVEWSFSTYARPFLSEGGNTAGNAEKDGTDKHHAVEEILWALMAGPATYTAPGSSQATGLSGLTFSSTASPNTTAGTGMTALSFSGSNKATLGTCNIYFSLDDGGSNPVVYKLDEAVVNEASVDFDVDGIATIAWSGFGKTLTESSKPTRTVFEAIGASNNFIRNRLTQLAITANDTTTFPGSGSGVYTLTLTGGNITISNNISFLTPETLGTVNLPIGHVTGARSVSGSFNCYLGLDSGTNTGTSTDFFNDLTSTAARSKIVNSFDLTFKLGGVSTSSTVPVYQFNFPTAHFEIPAHSVEDVISIETTFQALPSTIGNTDEVTVKFAGATPA
jgi:hypothetical protein